METIGEGVLKQYFPYSGAWRQCTREATVWRRFEEEAGVVEKETRSDGREGVRMCRES